MFVVFRSLRLRGALCTALKSESLLRGVKGHGDRGSSVCDSGIGFIAQPCLWIVLGQRLNVWVLHQHARTRVPSQYGVVVSMLRKFHGRLVVTHGMPQSVISRRTSPRVAMANARVSQSLQDDASIVSLLIVPLNSSENFLRLPLPACWSEIDRSPAVEN